MERALRRTGIVVLLVSILFVSSIALQSMLYPKVLPSLYFEEIDQGGTCGIQSRINYVIDDLETWETLWTDIHNISTSTPELPYVNFTKEIVIAVFLGEFATGGYVAEITRITPSLTGLTVHIMETHPGASCIVTMSITHPYYIVKASTISTQSVEFAYNVVIHNCP